MKPFITIAFCIVALAATAQQHRFLPKWKVGETKTITYTESEKEYINDELKSDTSSSRTATIKVINDNKDSYSLEYTQENVALTSLMELYDKLGDEVPEFQNMKLIYQVNKTTGKTELKNWKEARDFLLGSYEKMEKILEDKVPDMAPMANLLFMPIKSAYKDKETIEEEMEKNIQFLTLPFQSEFTIGEAITSVDSAANPFNASTMISVSTSVKLDSFDQTGQIAMFSQTIDMDLSQFVNMIKDMMMKMASSMGVEDSLMEKKKQEIDAMDMSMTNSNAITYDDKTTWTKQSIATVEIKGMDPRKGQTRKVVTITALVE